MDSPQTKPVKLTFPCRDDEKMTLAGPGEKNFILLERKFQVKIFTREVGITIQADSEKQAQSAKESLERLYAAMKSGHDLTDFMVEQMTTAQGSEDGAPEAPSPYEKPVVLDRYGNPIQPKTEGQARLVHAIKHNDVVFASGPAGTGKTFLAVSMAVAAMEKRIVDKIVLVRPAVESGESLGFLPGVVDEKIGPYMRPLQDALVTLLPPEKLKTLRETGAVEIAPLAYMRGRTLSRSFVILDEAQNTTVPQMKMFLTRIGLNTKVVLTGDESQVDLQQREVSGFAHARNILKDIDGISQVALSVADVVRHKLVMAIIEAYEKHTNPMQRT